MISALQEFLERIEKQRYRRYSGRGRVHAREYLTKSARHSPISCIINVKRRDESGKKHEQYEII